MVLNSLSFCFSVKLLISPSSQESLTGLSILGYRFFPFITLNMGFPGSSVVTNLLAEAGDKGSIPGLGRSPGGGNGNPLQSSCLGNPMGYIVHRVTKEPDMT